MNTTDKIVIDRAVAKQVLDALDHHVWGGTGSQLKSIRSARNSIRTALAQQDAQVVSQWWIPPSGLKIADIGFRWDSDALQHVPHVLVEFEPVPANLPNTEKGWADRDAFVEMLNAAPTPPAQQELSEAFRAELDKVSQRNFELRMENASLKAALTPPVQRVMLTDDEIEAFYFANFSMGRLKAFARDVIEAYERKNGLKP